MIGWYHEITLRLANGDTIQASASPWTTTGDDVTKWLVVLPNIGSLFMTSEELLDRVVEIG